jgi:hypothetical protein
MLLKCRLKMQNNIGLWCSVQPISLVNVCTKGKKRLSTICWVGSLVAEAVATARILTTSTSKKLTFVFIRLFLNGFALILLVFNLGFRSLLCPSVDFCDVCTFMVANRISLYNFVPMATLSFELERHLLHAPPSLLCICALYRVTRLTSAPTREKYFASVQVVNALIVCVSVTTCYVPLPVMQESPIQTAKICHNRPKRPLQLSRPVCLQHALAMDTRSNLFNLATLAWLTGSRASTLRTALFHHQRLVLMKL